jgi:hypothetical protein
MDPSLTGHSPKTQQIKEPVLDLDQQFQKIKELVKEPPTRTQLSVL